MNNPPTPLLAAKQFRLRRKTFIGEKIIHLILFFCASLSILTTAGIILTLFSETADFLSKIPVVEFLTGTEWTPMFLEKHFGIWPLICGTVLTSSIAIAIALPLGLLSAILLSEYAPLKLKKIIKPVLEVLAGIPTVVYGYFALLFITPLLQNLIPQLETFSALSAGLVMGIMILPMVSSLSEDAMTAVPRSLRDAGYAIGASRYQVVLKIVIPAAFSGITSATILAISRAIGETMIVTIAAGQIAEFTANPLIAIQTMTSYIVQVSLGDTPVGTLEYNSIFAVGSVLFLMTLTLNIVSYKLKERYREVYK